MRVINVKRHETDGLQIGGNCSAVLNGLDIIFAHGWVTPMSLGGNRMALDHSFTHSLDFD